MEQDKLIYQKVPTTVISGNTSVEVMPPGITAIRIVLWMALKAANIFFFPFYIAARWRKSKRCPPIENQLLLLPASELANRIRRKEVKSKEVVKAYISRIKEVNPIINAVVEDRFDAALDEAEAVDEMIANNVMTVEEMKEKKPLLGVPLTVKGSIGVANMNNTSGSLSRKNAIATEDAVPVKYARQAGAIPLVTSNTPELCMNWETTNKLIGTTRNPHNTTRTSGGSSGGEASLLGSAGSIIGIGSDVAGSLRLPAHFCGIWAHKPTPGIVSFEGHYPSCKQTDIWRDSFTLGPMARYAGDLKLLLDVIAEPTLKDTLKLHQKVDLRELKVFYMENFDSTLTGKMTEDCLQALHDVMNHFNEICYVKSAKVKLPLMKYVPEMAGLMLLNIDDVDNYFPNKGEGSIKEMLKFCINKSNATATCIFYGILRKLVHYVPSSTREGCEEKISELKSEFIRLLGNDGVFMCPSFPATAHYHGEVYSKLMDHGYLSAFNALSLPVTNCLVKFSKESLPVGIQVVAAPHCDRLSLAVAEEIERAFGGWQPPRSDRTDL